jgi:Fe2+ transport system protein FeoA
MPSATGPSLSLAEAQIGCEFRVVRVDADCDDAARLQAMGVCIGRRLSLVQAGDPLIICVVGSRVGISGRLAASVYVESIRLPHPEVP